MWRWCSATRPTTGAPGPTASASRSPAWATCSAKASANHCAYAAAGCPTKRSNNSKPSWPVTQVRARRPRFTRYVRDPYQVPGHTAASHRNPTVKGNPVMATKKALMVASTVDSLIGQFRSHMLCRSLPAPAYVHLEVSERRVAVQIDLGRNTSERLANLLLWADTLDEVTAP